MENSPRLCESAPCLSESILLRITERTGRRYYVLQVFRDFCMFISYGMLLRLTSLIRNHILEERAASIFSL